LSDLAGVELSLSMSRNKDPYAYVAKYVTKQEGDLHFGGTLANVNFSEYCKSLRPVGRKEIVPSPDMDWRFFHMNYTERKR